MSLQDITAVIITRDASAVLAAALDSVREFGDVVVFDNGTGDALVELCAAYPNVTLHRGEFDGFGPTKQRAVMLAKSDWVFSLDSDEAVSPALRRSLDAVDLSNVRRAFEVERHNYFTGRHITRGGWGNDWLLRLFHRDSARFDSAMVHEKVVADQGVRVERLDGALVHQAVTDVDQFLHKVSRYTELHREQPRRRYGPLLIAVKSGWAFFRSFVLQRGFMEGWRGLVIAQSNANGVFYKYIKVHADRVASKDDPPA